MTFFPSKKALVVPALLFTINSAGAQIIWMDSNLTDFAGTVFSGATPETSSATIYDLGVTHTMTPEFAGQADLGDAAGPDHNVYASPRMLNGNTATGNPVRIDSITSRNTILGWDTSQVHDAVVTFLKERSGDQSNSMVHELEFSRSVSREHQLLLAGIDRTSETLQVEFFNGGVKITDLTPLGFTLDQDYSEFARGGDVDDGVPTSSPVTVTSFTQVGGDISLDGISPAGAINEATADWSVLIVDIPETFNYDEIRLTFETDGTSAPDYDSFGFTLVHSIPEPSAITLSLLACAGLLARRRRG